MNKIIDIDQAVRFAEKFRMENKIIVLCGGVFDIVHKGHIKFLQQAKKQGDVLFVFVESDKKVRETKGRERPINNQELRARTLSDLSDVTFVIMLPFLKSDKNYDQLVAKIKPDIIATTHPDPFIFHKERQAKISGAKIAEVIEKIPNTSTTDLLNK